MYPKLRISEDKIL